ncbi:MAG: 4'-phosphopantetheinyl transferase superfamily protein [Desulfatitalea sp.]
MRPAIHPVILPVSAADQRLVRRSKVEALRRRARQAATQSALHGGWLLDTFEKDADGVPLPSNGIYWSLSHKEDMVAAVVAPWPVGIDLEKMRPITPGLYKRLADASEWALAPRKDEVIFFRYWTAKEAVLKAVGKGLTALSHCRIERIVDDLHLRLIYEKTPWTVTHRWIGTDHLVTVTSENTVIQWPE